MKYWIGVNAILNNQGFLNALGKATPNKVDSRLWQTDEYKSIRGIDPDGNNFFYASLFYETEIDCDDMLITLKGINGMLHSTMKGSYIIMTKCWHDEKVNGLCTRRDEIVYEERV